MKLFKIKIRFMKKIYNVLQLVLVVTLFNVYANVNAQYVSLYEADFTTDLPAYDSDLANSELASIKSLEKISSGTPDWIGANQVIQGVNNWYLEPNGKGLWPGNWRGANLKEVPLNWTVGEALRFTIDLNVHQLSKNMLTEPEEDYVAVANQMIYGFTIRRIGEGANNNGADGAVSDLAYTMGIGVDATVNIGQLKIYIINDKANLTMNVSDLQLDDKLRIICTAIKSTTANEFDIAFEVYKAAGEDFNMVGSTVQGTVTHADIYAADASVLAFTSYSKLNRIKYDFNGDGTATNDTEDTSTTVWSYLNLEKNDSPTSIGGVEKSPLQEISVYPNPVLDILSVRNLENNEVVNVYNATGILVASVPASANVVSIDMKPLPSGIYIVKAGKQTTRVLKK